MRRVVLVCALVVFLNPLRADPSLEKRVTALERQVLALQDENRKLKESAVEFLSVQLIQKEKEHARVVYRMQILPMIKPMIEDFGSKGPVLPKEEEINSMADAYRPLFEMITSISSVAAGK